MNTTKLLKLAPTLIMVGAMAYAGYSIDPRRRPPRAPRPRVLCRPRAETGPTRARASPATRRPRARRGAETRSWCSPGQARPGRPRPISPPARIQIDPYLASWRA